VINASRRRWGVLRTGNTSSSVMRDDTHAGHAEASSSNRSHHGGLAFRTSALASCVQLPDSGRDIALQVTQAAGRRRGAPQHRLLVQRGGEKLREHPRLAGGDRKIPEESWMGSSGSAPERGSARSRRRSSRMARRAQAPRPAARGERRLVTRGAGQGSALIRSDNPRSTPRARGRGCGSRRESSQSPGLRFQSPRPEGSGPKPKARVLLMRLDVIGCEGLEPLACETDGLCLDQCLLGSPLVLQRPLDHPDGAHPVR